MIRKMRAAAVLLVAAVGAAWAWRGARRPNVLLITVDAVRADYVSADTTPHLERLAEQGVRFTQAVTDAPWTRAAMASVMTGRYGSHHHVEGPFDRLADAELTMAEQFRAAGYLTAAVVSSYQLESVFQLDQGFTIYDERLDAPVVTMSTERTLHVPGLFYGNVADDAEWRRRKLQADAMRDADETTDAAIGVLRRVGVRPFFLWVHYFGAHERWPIGTGLTSLVMSYRPAVEQTDREVGRLLDVLDRLGMAGNTIVVLHGDHGQELLDHGGFGHGDSLYEPALRVPLLMRWPGRLPAGRRIDALTRLVDMFPTVAELSGLRLPPALDGNSLVPMLRGASASVEAEAYCETFLAALRAASVATSEPDAAPLRFGFIRRGIRTERWKYIRSIPSPLLDVAPVVSLPAEMQRTLATDELYDLQQDPREQHNLAGAQPAVVADLRARLDRHAHYQ